MAAIKEFLDLHTTWSLEVCSDGDLCTLCNSASANSALWFYVIYYFLVDLSFHFASTLRSALRLKMVPLQDFYTGVHRFYSHICVYLALIRAHRFIMKTNQHSMAKVRQRLFYHKRRIPRMGWPIFYFHLINIVLNRVILLVRKSTTVFYSSHLWRTLSSTLGACYLMTPRATWLIIF